MRKDKIDKKSAIGNIDKFIADEFADRLKSFVEDCEQEGNLF